MQELINQKRNKLTMDQTILIISFYWYCSQTWICSHLY